MTFYAIELDTCPAFGWEGGPNTDILIRALRNKHERRNWVDGLILHTFALPFKNVRDPQHLEDVKSMFMVMHGPHHSFLAKDYGDYRHGFDSAGQEPMVFATVTDDTVTTYQLTKTYTKGSATYVRPITKPLLGTGDDSAEEELKIYVNGVHDPSAMVDPLTGEVEFGTGGLAEGDVLSWTGEFRVPVRFSSFYLPAVIDSRMGEDYAVSGSCTLQEVVGE